MNTQTVSLDVTKPSAIPPVVTLGQGDANGTTLVANIYDDGTALTLTSYSVKLCIQTPNGAGYYECDGTVSGNAATFAIDETYAGTVAGVSKIAYVEVIDGDTVVCSTNRFTVIVLQNGTEGADPNGAYTNGVQQFLEDAQEQLDEAIEGALSTKADADGAYPDLYAGAAGELAGYSEGTSIAYTGSRFYGLKVYGESVQNGTPTPSAPVPIKAVEAPNLLDISTSPERNNATVVISDGSVTVTATGASGWSFTGWYIPVSEVGSYTLSCDMTGGRARLFKYNGNTSLGYSDVTDGKATVTTDANTTRLRVLLYSRDTISGAVGDASTFSDIMLEKGSTASPYTPYGCIGLECGGIQTPIDLRGNKLCSLPDGTKDELSIDSAGAVTLTKRVGRIDFGTQAWSWQSSWLDWYTAYYNINCKNPSSTDVAANALADGYVAYAATEINYAESTVTNGFALTANNNGNTRFIVRNNDSVNTPTGYMYYPLKTPQTITLDPIEQPDTSGSGTISVTAALTPTIRVSLGEFGISADELRDSSLAAIAAIENGKASTNYAVGSYLIHKGTLYKVITAIASGEEITPGTNVTATTVMAELIALTS